MKGFQEISIEFNEIVREKEFIAFVIYIINL